MVKGHIKAGRSFCNTKNALLSVNLNVNTNMFPNPKVDKIGHKVVEKMNCLPKE